MVKIRLHGLLDEVNSMVSSLKQNYEVLSVSKPYKDRNNEIYRIYVEIKEKS